MNLKKIIPLPIRKWLYYKVYQKLRICFCYFINKNKKFQNIMIYFNNGVGNFVLFIPFLLALKDKYNAKITFLFDEKQQQKAVIEMAENLDEISQVFILQKDRQNINFLDYDLIILPFSGLSETYYELKKFEHKQKLIDSKDIAWNWHKVHELDYNMVLFNFLGGYNKKIPEAKVSYTKKIKIKKEKLKIGINNSSLNKNKKWPTISLVNLIKRLKKELDCKIILLGGMSELSEAQKIKKQVKTKIYDFVGKTNISETIGIIKQCGVFISNDSGLMHIAGALDIPTIALFGPTLETKNKPLGKNIIIIRSNACKPCFGTKKYKNCENNICMKAITVDEVFLAVIRLLNNEK